MYLIHSAKAYRKAYKRVSRHKDFDAELLDEVIDTLAAGKSLGVKHHDHQLVGELQEYRECHIKGDILLVYQIRENILVLLLADIGSHSELFNK